MRKLFLSCALTSLLAMNAQKSGIVLSSMDKKANPTNNFYEFCNGSWQKKFKLSESDSRYGSFNEINDNNLKKIKLIYEDISKNKTAETGSNIQKLRDFYNTAMDSALAEKTGLIPLKEQLTWINNVKNTSDLMTLKAQFETIGINLLFASEIGPDLKNSKKHSFGITQAGYGLGDRDYYYSPAYEKIRTEYLFYLKQLFELSGERVEASKAMAGQVLDFEKRLTEAALTRVQMRDVEKLYNPLTVTTIKSLTESNPWDYYFKYIQIENTPDTIVVQSIEYLKSMWIVVSKTPIEQFKTYAKAQLLMHAAPFLNSRFVEANFNFNGKVLSGAKKMKPKWERVHRNVTNLMGEIIGEEFVKRNFTAKSKEKVNKLIDNLILAYRDRIASRTWMDEQTKKQANRKLDLLIRKVGYPDKWKDYNKLTVGTSSYWENICSANNFGFKKSLEDLSKPVDRSKWQMSPVTVNAYYDPTTNEITFPAAILQPPFFDVDADDAANYGTMGSIIGHELTHGFDDQGAQFDADGNMKMWWTKQDYENFKTRKQGIVNQFNSYIAIDTIHVNGSMTQGENIADLGGLTMAYYAYKKALNGKPSKMIDGFTGEQRFFIAWAQGWKTVTRDEELKRLLTVDFHSPGYFRAWAPLTNMKEFYEAFKVKVGDKMYTPDEKRVEIW
ncbi:MAG: M13 family metallopeptidase [Bacteroidetes bacterium]|nr:M13 family metallopeptidase [Bacteroidota bacterium]